MLEIDTLATFDTVYSADSVEWCPASENHFVVGTYQLEEKDQTTSSNNIRKGRIYLFHHENDSMNVCQQIETDAILDQKWDKLFLNAATSLGNVQKYKLINNRLEMVTQINISPQESNNLALSIDISASGLLISDSNGRITLVDSEETIKQQWKAHNFEAWTCMFDPWDENLVYSGGDDSMFHVWDLRTGPMKVKSAKRDAGVTSFLNLKENILLVGSYDEKMCSYDLRNVKRPFDEINLNGGVWRIKQSKMEPSKLLIACMYHNFSIVDCTTNLKLIAEHNGHSSICYGCDWSPINLTFACCSFYDHKLTLCQIKKNVE